MVDALFCLTDPGDEVVLTDPTYAGMLNRVRLVGAVPRLVPLYVGDREWRLDLDALRAAVTDRTRVVFVNNASFPSGWVASEGEWDAVASVCRDNDLRLLYWGGFEGVLFDGRTVQHPAALDGMRDRTVTIGAPTLEQRMIAWRIGWIVAPGELVDDVSRVHIYNGLVPSGFNQIGTRVALSLDDTALRRRTRNGSGDGTRRYGNSRAFPPYAPQAHGRSSSTSRRWDSTVWMRRSFCSSRRSLRRRCAAGEARSPIGTSASSSATSRSNASRASASVSAPRLDAS